MRRGYFTNRERYAAMRAQGWKCSCGCGAPVWPGCTYTHDEHTRALGLYDQSEDRTLKPDAVMVKWCHSPKTRRDVKDIAKARRMGAKHRGEQRRKGPKIQSRGFDKPLPGYQYQWPKRKMGR